MHTAEPHRRQIICQLPADPRGLTITQQKRYCSRCPYVFGLSHGELAGKMSVPLGTAKSWTRRGLMSLQECMG